MCVSECNFGLALVPSTLRGAPAAYLKGRYGAWYEI